MGKWKDYKEHRGYKKRVRALVNQILDGGAVIANMDVVIPIEVGSRAIGVTLFNVNASHANQVKLSINGKPPISADKEKS